MAGTSKTSGNVRSHCARFIAILLALITSSSAVAQIPRSLIPTGGSSSRSERKNALEAIPYGSLTADAAQRIRAVVNRPTIYRRLPIRTIESDPQLFLFLIRNPEVVVDIWQQMGVTQLELERVSDFQFQSSDGAGTDSQVELVYGTPNLHVYYGTGVYEGPMFKKKIHGQCVMLLRTDFQRSDGQVKVRNRLDVFLHIDQGAVDLVAKTISPLFGRTADINFSETSNFLTKLSQAAETSGPRMRNIAARMKTVSPPVKNQFVRIASTVSERANSQPTRVARPPANRPHSVRPASANVNRRRPIMDSRIEMPVLR